MGTPASPDAVDAELREAARTRSWRACVQLARSRGAARTPAQHRADTHYVEHAEARSARMIDMLLGAAARNGMRAPAMRGTVLDLGVGEGSSLRTLTSRFESVVGIEVNPVRAFLAQLRARELGVQDRVSIVCTDGAHIPLASASVDLVVAVNVIEHLCDALEPVLDDVARILVPGGCLVADSRNRYDVAFPEPHVRLRGVGALPRSWQEPYVRLRGVERHPRTRLLSKRELTCALEKRFSRVTVGLAPPSAFERSARWDPLVDALHRVPAFGEALAWIYPSHAVCAQR